MFENISRLWNYAQFRTKSTGLTFRMNNDLQFGNWKTILRTGNGVSIKHFRNSFLGENLEVVQFTFLLFTWKVSAENMKIENNWERAGTKVTCMYESKWSECVFRLKFQFYRFGMRKMRQLCIANTFLIRETQAMLGQWGREFEFMSVLGFFEHFFGIDFVALCYTLSWAEV